MTVRTRFAPSPTGFLHVGGVRTALFSWLYAKRHKGHFILRIEDTDRERSTQESVQAILDGMSWLGLDSDEGPFYQTERYHRYNEVAQQFLQQGKAYRCECSKERLEALREAQLNAKEKPRYDGHCRNKNLPESDTPFVIRFKNPDSGTVSFHDEVYGDIHVENSELDDLILVRSDGHPTYNFAVVIDDIDMNITHVIRGDDHINNTPRQINLFKALNAPIPVFAHLPMILGDDGKRLSKRHGAVSVLQFKEMGILPHALLNYLVRLGWSHGDQEIFSVEEMIANFDLGHVSRGVSSFNYDKLYWLNQHYQKSDSPESVADALCWHFEQAGIDLSKGPALKDLVATQAERCKTLAEMCQISQYFYSDSIEYDEDAVKKHLRPVVLEPLTALYERFQSISEWQNDMIQECINDVCAQFDMNMGKIAQPLRVAVTGASMSPSIDMTLFLLGKQRVLTRLAVALEKIKARAANAQ
ncbi:glutamate--tRNA ligase [Legionella fallonii]|nr:glutamate--tRNA ligase [Legionella fallonii]